MLIAGSAAYFAIYIKIRKSLFGTKYFVGRYN